MAGWIIPNASAAQFEKKRANGVLGACAGVGAFLLTDLVEFSFSDFVGLVSDLVEFSF